MMLTRHRGILLPLLLATAGLGAAVAGGAGTAGVPERTSEGWRLAAPGHAWRFPADDWSHPEYRTEWWYFTGHLRPRDGDPATPRFGFQFTVFRIGILPQPPPLASAWTTGGLLMGHASITDLRTGRHVFSEVLHRQVPLLARFGSFPDPEIAWSRGPAGTSTPWRLVRTPDGGAGEEGPEAGEAAGGTGRETGFAFTAADRHRGLGLDLRARPTLPPVLEGPDGYSRKGEQPGSASLYYSRPRMEVEGRLSLDGHAWDVEGTAWMDREFGSDQLDRDQVGWDWFGLQLADGRSLMIYQLRDAEGRLDFGRGTLISPTGRPTYLEPSAWRLTPLATWRSERTAAVYPSRWRLTIPSAALDLLIEPRVADQENVSERAGGLFYWEGAVEVRQAGDAGERGGGGSGAAGPGTLLGRGYAELTGYGKGSRPPI